MDDIQADAFVHAVTGNWRSAPLSPIDRTLCEYAEKLTHTPSAISHADLDKLREIGFDDRTIHDATQVISYFNYINRIADALGVEPEDFITPWGK
jgi:uncharacterized peroxidase-related enzyme